MNNNNTKSKDTIEPFHFVPYRPHPYYYNSYYSWIPYYEWWSWFYNNAYYYPVPYEGFSNNNTYYGNSSVNWLCLLCIVIIILLCLSSSGVFGPGMAIGAENFSSWFCLIIVIIIILSCLSSTGIIKV